MFESKLCPVKSLTRFQSHEKEIRRHTSILVPCRFLAFLFKKLWKYMLLLNTIIAGSATFIKFPKHEILPRWTCMKERLSSVTRQDILS